MKKISILLIGIFLIYNTYVTLRLIKVTRTFKEFSFLYSSAQIKSNSQSTYIKMIHEKKTQEIHLNNNNLNSNIILFDDLENEFSLADIIQEKKLVLRFFDSNCAPCINKYLSRIIERQSELKRNNILLIVTSKDRDTFDTAFNTKELEVYFTDSIKGLDFDKQEIPYFFILSEELIINDSYIPEETELNLLDIYISRHLSLIDTTQTSI